MKRERDADVNACNDNVKQPRGDNEAVEAPPESSMSLGYRAIITAHHALHEALASQACDLQATIPCLKVLTEAVSKDCLTSVSIASMLGLLNRILTKLPAELHTTRAAQVQEFAAQLLQLLEAWHNQMAEWHNVPEAPKTFLASTLWVVKSATPTMLLACDPTPPCNLCTAALKLLLSAQKGYSLLENHGDKLVVDAVMDVLKQGSDPDAKTAAGELLFCMTKDCSNGFLGRLLEWGTVSSLVDAIISGSPYDLSNDAVAVLGNICISGPEPSQVVALRQAMQGLVPVLVEMVLVRPHAACDHVRLLEYSFCEDIHGVSEYVEAGAIPALVAYMRATGGLEHAVELLSYLIEDCRSAAQIVNCGGAQTLVSCLSCADSYQFRDIVECLGNTIKHITAHGAESEVTMTRSHCLQEGVGGQQHPQHEPALVGRRAGRQDANRLTEHLNQLLGPKVPHEELFLFTTARTAWAACHPLKPILVSHLKSMMLDCGMLRLLCETLADNEAYTPSHAPVWHHWRVSALTLHVLVDRLMRAREALADNLSLGSHGGHQSPTGAASQPADADEVVLHCAVPRSMLRGQRGWTNVKVVVEGRAYCVLQEVLRLASPFFRNMLEGSWRESGSDEIVLGEIGCDEWEVVLEHIYTGGADVPAALAEQVLAVSGRFLLEKLKGACQELLIKQLDTSNVLRMFVLSLKHSAELLQCHCMLLMLKHWSADGDFTAPAASAAVISEGHQAGELPQGPSAPSPSGGTMGFLEGDQAADGGCAEEREAHVEEELRGMVAAALLPCLRQLLDQCSSAGCSAGTL